MARKPLLGLEIKVEKAAAKALEGAANILLEEIKDNVSLIDHSLADLKADGHPYSQRNPQNIHRPNFKVHRQSGTLLGAVGMNKKGKLRIQVGVDDSAAPHAPHIIFGTSKMVSRDFITGSFNKVSSKMADAIENSINQGIKDAGE